MLLGSYLDEKNNKMYDVIQKGSFLGRKVSRGTIQDSEGNFIQNVAIKLVIVTTSNPEQNNCVNTEINILKTIKHKNTVKFITSLKRHCENKDIIHYLVMEYCKDGDLDHYLSNKSLLEFKIQDYFRQTLKGLIYLHSKKISHRDIKPSNLLLIDDIIKIADYGVSKLLGISMNLRTPFMGTFGFMAPEVYDNDDGLYSIEADVFSLGITLFYLYYKKTPLDLNDSIYTKGPKEIKKKYHEVLSSGYKLFDENVDICSEAKDLIRKMIDYKKEKRIKLQEIKQHAFLKKKFPNKESIVKRLVRVFKNEAKEICVWQKCFENIYRFSEFCNNKKVWVTALVLLCKEIDEKSYYLYKSLKDRKPNNKFSENEWEVFYNNDKYDEIRRKLRRMARNAQKNSIALDEKFFDQMRKEIILSDDFISIVKKLLVFYRKHIEAEKDNDDFIQTIVWLVLMLKQKVIRKIKIENMNQKEKENLLEKHITYIDQLS